MLVRWLLNPNWSLLAPGKGNLPIDRKHLKLVSSRFPIRSQELAECAQACTLRGIMVEFNWHITFLQEHSTDKGKTPQVIIHTTSSKHTAHWPLPSAGMYMRTAHPKEESGKKRCKTLQACQHIKSPRQGLNGTLELSSCPVGPLPSVLYFLSFLL